MAGSRKNKAFAETIFPTWPLDDATAWIQSNMKPEDVFDVDELEKWAKESGWIKE